MIYIIPQKGLRLRDPQNTKLFVPEEGMETNPSSFWTRRENDGDIKIYPAMPKVKTPEVKTQVAATNGETK